MKLIIQIPCYNEAESLPKTLADLPRQLDGITKIEYQIIDDGSTDNTVEIARQSGVHHIVSLPYHQGLAQAFYAGLKNALKKGADIIVNTDADNQYKSEFIQELINPILKKEADIVIGCRPIDQIEHFSPLKKWLQKTGSRLVQFFTGIEIPDVTTGFRSYSRRAARMLKTFSDFTYTIETIIQAAKSNLCIKSITVETNPPMRPSRLFKSNFFYIRKQVATIIRIWALYNPVRLFFRSGLASIFLGSTLLVRFLYYYLICWPEPSGKIQSLIISAILFIFGFLLVLIGVIADLIAVNRRLLEDLTDHLERNKVPQQDETNETH